MVTKKTKEAEMLELFKSNVMKTLNDRVSQAGPEWTKKCIQKGERSVLDFIMI